MDPIYIAISVSFLWLIIISFFLFRTRKHYYDLTSKTGGKNIDHVLDSLLKTIDQHKKSLDDLNHNVNDLEKKSAQYFQKIGYVKFNPFERDGGDQSFVVALLDSRDNGMVMTFLYTREGVRIYAKPVKSGVGGEYALSDEESEAIKIAE